MPAYLVYGYSCLTYAPLVSLITFVLFICNVLLFGYGIFSTEKSASKLAFNWHQSSKLCEIFKFTVSKQNNSFFFGFLWKRVRWKWWNSGEKLEKWYCPSHQKNASPKTAPMEWMSPIYRDIIDICVPLWRQLIFLILLIRYHCCKYE